MKRLNIFVDETGEFGLEKGSSEIYGVSFTFHEQSEDIMPDINALNSRLKKLGYTKMLHMADLILKRGDYSNFNIKLRKSIFNSIYNFSRKIPVKYCTIIVDKKYCDSVSILKKKLSIEINKIIKSHEDFFNKFDKIVMYYDNGQETLGVILDSVFYRFENFEHRKNFDHREKRLFQVSDMLTYMDKLFYKYNHNLSFSKSELYFFSNEELRKIMKELNKKRL